MPRVVFVARVTTRTPIKDNSSSGRVCEENDFPNTEHNPQKGYYTFPTILSPQT